MTTRQKETREATGLRGIWLTPGPVETTIESLLLPMLAPVQADMPLRHAVIEELHRRAKLTEVALRYLGLHEHGVDPQQPALWLV